MRYDLTGERTWARDWLFECALPLWWANGADHEAGGWFDKLDQTGKPVDLPKRLRVQARQVFVYAEAGRLGWDGPWTDACRHGIDFILAHFKRSDGLFRASVTREGAPVIEAPDLYDQAFVLFALAVSYARLDRSAELRAEAAALIGQLEKLLGHPERGFEEANPRQLPLRSNPHMHMLEAMLAWVEAGAGEPFQSHAHAIVELACDKLIDPATGAIGEYYDGNWDFDMEIGHLREPGHQFEWAYLLHSASRILGGDHAERCDRLRRFGAEYGVVDGRAVFSVATDGVLVDGSSRLWAQTERLRTMLVLAPTMDEAEADAAIDAATETIATLKRFLNVSIPGLWVDRVTDCGTWINEPAPASSFYHIVTGLVPLIESHDLAPAVPAPELLARSV